MGGAWCHNTLSRNRPCEYLRARAVRLLNKAYTRLCCRERGTPIFDLLSLRRPRQHTVSRANCTCTSGPHLENWNEKGQRFPRSSLRSAHDILSREQRWYSLSLQHHERGHHTYRPALWTATYATRPYRPSWEQKPPSATRLFYRGTVARRLNYKGEPVRILVVRTTVQKNKSARAH